MAFEQEIDEALEAADYALDSLRKAESDLDSASSWGMFDILGGGLISTLIKHNDMDDAQAHMEEAKGALEKLSQELKDVDYQINLDFTVSDFLSFADYFFDGLLADLFVQDRIDEAEQQVKEAITKVESIREHLSHLRQQAQ
mgnify:FL=1